MKRVLLAPYNLGSAGAKALALGIGAKRTPARKRFKRDALLINWGRSDMVVQGFPYKVLNKPEKVIRATNKLFCLNRLKEAGVSAVEHTVNALAATVWVAKGGVVYGRQLLNASQGKGIVIFENDAIVTRCPLYTKGVLKAHEYRVHVFQDKILDVTKKRRRNNIDRNDYIKNLANGWVYCREGIEIPDNLLQCAKDAIKALELDFGAVDILYHKGVPYVLEINTAPGLQGTTLAKYVAEFSKLKYL